MLKIPHSMPFLLLGFLLKNMLLFWWVCLCLLLFFLSYSLQYSFLVLCVNCFNDNMPWRGYILVMSFWCPGSFIYLNEYLFLKIWELFVILFCWIYYISLWIALLLLHLCPRFTGLVFLWNVSVLHIPIRALESFF
jgi:hypothetical protein